MITHNSNRLARRQEAKRTGTEMIKGIHNSLVDIRSKKSRVQLKEVWVEFKTKSRAGVEYLHNQRTLVENK